MANPRAVACLLALLATAATFVPVHSACIATLAANTPALSTLVAAVNAADLMGALESPESPITVFAPTNEAFESAIAALNTTAEELLADTATLMDVLMYHVVPLAVMSTELTDGMEIPTLLEGSNLMVSIEDGSVMIVPGMSYDGRPATVTMPDVLPEDCDSIVHVINKVLLPA